MGAFLVGIGTATPAHTIAQRDAAELAKAFCCQTDEQTRLLPVLYRRTRIRQRGSVLLDHAMGSASPQSFFSPAQGTADRGPTTQQRMQRYAREAPPLALSAARGALRESGLTPRQITELVTVSCTGFIAPGIDLALINALGLPRTIGRTHVGFMGCHGALNGLRVASALVRADPDARVLLCAVELCSLHFRYGWDPAQVVGNALFADGAAAAVLIHARRAPANAWRVVANGSSLFPDSAEAMTWRIGDYGFEMMLSAQVPALIAEHLRPWLTSWLRQQGLTVPAIRSWAIHPGGPRILSTVEACLRVPPRAMAASRAVLVTHGNMSSPTVLFILKRLRRAAAARPCVALGFGPGLAVEAALLDV